MVAAAVAVVSDIAGDYRAAGAPSDAACWRDASRVHPAADPCGFAHFCILRIAGRVGVHPRAATLDRLGAQFEVPGLVAVDLAQPVLGAVLGQPRRAAGGPDVDRVPGHVRGGVCGGDPSCSFLFGPVLGDRRTEKRVLVVRGAPAAVDRELDAVFGSVARRVAQGLEQVWVEVGDARDTRRRTRSRRRGGRRPPR